MRHFDSDHLEAYSLGHLSPSDARSVEEHLLVCEDCRRSLDRVEAEIQFIRDLLWHMHPKQ